MTLMHMPVEQRQAASPRPYIFIQDNARRHQQLSKIGDVDPSCLHFGEINARLFQKLYAVLSKHVISQLELPA